MKKNRIIKTVLIASAFLILIINVSAGLAGTIGDAFNNILCPLAIAAQKIGPPLAFLIFLIAAAIWAYSAEDPGKRAAAKTWMLHALIGLIILLIARAIITGVKVGTTTISLPAQCGALA